MAKVKDIYEARQLLRLSGISIHLDRNEHDYLLNHITGGDQSTERRVGNLDDAMVVGAEMAQSKLPKPGTAKPKPKSKPRK